MNDYIMNLFSRYLDKIFCKNEREFIDTKVIKDDINEINILVSQVKELNNNLNAVKKKKLEASLKINILKKTVDNINKEIEDKKHVIDEINSKVFQIKRKLNIYRDQINKTLKKQCIICMNDCQIPKGVLPCKHEFCYNCVNKWSTQKKICPICKKQFSNIKKETEYKIDKNNDINELKEILKIIDNL